MTEPVHDLFARFGRQDVPVRGEQLDAVVLGRVVAGGNLDGPGRGVFSGNSTPTVGVAATSASSTVRPTAISAARIASRQHPSGAAAVTSQDQRAGRLAGRVGTREPRRQFRSQMFTNDTPQS